ncbi:MAG: PhnD/SsuA/transferrin family substrate-binding protein [Verrucomicrobiota bacterium]
MKKPLLGLLISLATGLSCLGADLHIGFSAEFFEGINQTDAMAAMKVWSESVATSRGITINSHAKVYKDCEELGAALRADKVDLLVVLSHQMIALRDQGLLDPEFVSLRNGNPSENYLLLVHRDGGISNIADLGQKAVVVQSNARASLGERWFKHLMAEQGIEESRFPVVTEASKVSKVVLPVFFKKADACLVTRNGYGILCEFNPQLAKQLVVLTESPGFVPTSICFRSNYKSEIHGDLIAGLSELHLEPRGQQVLMLFKVDALQDYDAALMENVEELLGNGPPGSSDARALAVKEQDE